MKTFLRELLIIFLVAVVAIVFTKLFWTSNKEIDKQLKEIQRTRAMVDSISFENRKLKEKIDSLNAEGNIRIQEITALKTKIEKQQKSLKDALEALYVYKNSDDHLLYELNELIKSPPPTLPK